MEQFLDENAKPNLSPQAAPQVPDGIDKISGQGIGMVEPNPLTEADQPASPEEQAEYEDVFRRVMAMVHDTRENGGKKSIADAIIKQISNSELPSYVSIGQAAGNAMRLFHENAKRQGKEFSGDVLREVGMDLVTELIDMGRELKAVKNVPEEDSPQMEKFVELAALEAAKHFGEYMLKTGQADVEGEQEAYIEQMQREATSGALDDWNMQNMDPQALQNAIAQQKGIA